MWLDVTVLEQRCIRHKQTRNVNSHGDRKIHYMCESVGEGGEAAHGFVVLRLRGRWMQLNSYNCRSGSLIWGAEWGARTTSLRRWAKTVPSIPLYGGRYFGVGSGPRGDIETVHWRGVFTRYSTLSWAGARGLQGQ